MTDTNRNLIINETYKAKALTEKKYEQQVPTESSRVVRGAGEFVPNTSYELHTEGFYLVGCLPAACTRYSAKEWRARYALVLDKVDAVKR